MLEDIYFPVMLEKSKHFLGRLVELTKIFDCRHSVTEIATERNTVMIALRSMTDKLS